jgi:hypothetical protein
LSWIYKYQRGKPESKFNVESAEYILEYCKGITTSMELGAGTGELSCLIKKGAPGVFTYMVDSSPSAINYIQEYFRDQGFNEGLDYSISKIDITEPDRDFLFPKYDLIMSSGLIEHFKGRDKENSISLHKFICMKYVVIIVPNATEENLKFAESDYCRERYGYEKPMTMKELDRYFEEDDFEKIAGKSFYKKEKLIIGIYRRKDDQGQHSGPGKAGSPARGAG